MISSAIEFALEAHAGQKYGGVPFWIHPAHAAEVARGYGLPDFAVAAVWLHDTLEDCEAVTFGQLAEEFGQSTANLVWAVTNMPGSRRERHPATYAKIRSAGIWAGAVKLCDRIANVEYCLTPGGRKDLFKMYKKEYPEFKKALQCGSDNYELWEYLDVLMEEEIS